MFNVHPLIDTLSPVVTSRVENCISPPSPVSEQSPCITQLPPDVLALKWPMAPSLSALVSALMALATAVALSVPSDAAPKAVADRLQVASNVPESAVSHVAGGAPVRSSI